MPRPPSLYDLLGVTPSATAEEIRAAYHRAAREVHPDVGGSAGAFHRLTTAYRILHDPTSRAHYDRILAGRVSGPIRPEWVTVTGAGEPASPPEWSSAPAGPAGGRPSPPVTFPGVSPAARRRYLVMMTVALTLFVLAGTVVRPLSVPAAIAMAVVAMLIPPIAAIMANRPGDPGTGQHRAPPPK